MVKQDESEGGELVHEEHGCHPELGVGTLSG